MRRLEYRRREGTGVPVWALTAYGRSLVVPLVPWLRPPAAHDVGARFLEHTLLLNDVLAGLVTRLRPSPTAPLAALPFRWLSEDDGVLEFERYDRTTATTCKSVLKPDAIVEIPGRRRRLFLEAETGTQSIATESPGRNGAVTSKLVRYAAYFQAFAGSEGDATWYKRVFPDHYQPRLVFLVHSDERRARVAAALKAWLGSSPPSRFQAFVLTFDQGARTLAPYITEGLLHAPPARGARVVMIDAAKAERLREGYQQLGEAFLAMRELVERHNATTTGRPLPIPALRVDAVQALEDFIQRELASGASDGESRRSGATHG
ncbi:MAG TPA: replication-relaxation family protein [Anaeromyxobacteraceae bacterium]|nr:replication-relaxation family protein [Anaeromyxobacteraceae bacterium]